MPFSDLSLGNPFDDGLPSWNFCQTQLFFDPSPEDDEPVVFTPHPSTEPLNSSSSSYTSNPAPMMRNSGLDDPSNRNNSRILESCPDETDRLGSVMDERKRRRMISNRLSAGRSRMRKQKHLENLRNQFNRLRIDNRELMNQVRLMAHQTRLVRWENEHLWSEAEILWQRLWDKTPSSARPPA